MITTPKNTPLINVETLSALTECRGKSILEQATLTLHKACDSLYSELVEFDRLGVIGHSLALAQNHLLAESLYAYPLADSLVSVALSQPYSDYFWGTNTELQVTTDNTPVNYLIIPLRSSTRDIIGALVSVFSSHVELDNERLDFHRVISFFISHSLEHQRLLDRTDSLIYQLSHEVSHDNLTNLMNRNYMEDKLERLIESKSANFILVVLDIDHFQEINDLHGHYVGDKVLRHIAQEICQIVQNEHERFRLSGDEFAFILTDDDPSMLCYELHDTLERGFHVGPHKISLSARMGLASYTHEVHSAEQLIANASIALNDSKTHRGEVIRWFDSHLNQQYMRRTQLIELLKEEINKPLEQTQELYVVVQPIVTKDEHHWNYFEVLARWHQPLLGEVSPLEFIEAAEQSGLIIQLGEKIIELACLAKKELEASLGYPVKLGINCSAEQLSHTPNYIEFLTTTLARYQFSPSSFTIELTESVLLSPTTDIVYRLDTLRRLGFTIALDDFGTGYSSLNYIHSYPIDCIKIDATFVRNMLTNQTSERVISLIIQLAKQLDVDLIAEGVETKQALDKLYQMGCQQIQGFYFSRPLKPQDMPNKLPFYDEPYPAVDKTE